MNPAASAYILRSTKHHLEPVEVFKVILLGKGDKLIRVLEVARGSEDQVIVDANHILGMAKYWGSTRVVLAHNHPHERSVIPSQADLDLTKLFKRYLRPFRIKVLDHIILGSSDYVSLTRDCPSLLRRIWNYLY